jgi:hypothetical protein
MCWPLANGRVESSFLPLLSFLPRFVIFFVLLPPIDSLLKSRISLHGYPAFRLLIIETTLRVYDFLHVPWPQMPSSLTTTATESAHIKSHAY